MSFTPMHLYFDDVEVGQEWMSLGRTVTEADIVGFAGLSGDFNPIHVDHAHAANTPFRRPVAHGLLVLSISSGLSLYAPPMRTIAFLALREWEFKEPVFPGDTIRVRTRVLEKHQRARGRRGEVLWGREALNQENKVVMQGKSLTLVEGRGATARGGGPASERHTDAT